MSRCAAPGRPQLWGPGLARAGDEPREGTGEEQPRRREWAGSPVSGREQQPQPRGSPHASKELTLDLTEMPCGSRAMGPAPLGSAKFRPPIPCSAGTHRALLPSPQFQGPGHTAPGNMGQGRRMPLLWYNSPAVCCQPALPSPTHSLPLARHRPPSLE